MKRKILIHAIARWPKLTATFLILALWDFATPYCGVSVLFAKYLFVIFGYTSDVIPAVESLS
ncbi:hypothetical protein [Pseudomonas savastanoi]|uniref:hypothetical protein n=1 Tax=Pseudomonas savastanoi TaxID=29438 RepID=UPI0001F6FE6A|nr:hypothetical protein [Pseudomonas savastanoi]EFW79379.1 hypothetical protein PsgB076_18066 [Pseudomonas savastanoi pv. glycinea str. B076]